MLVSVAAAIGYPRAADSTTFGATVLPDALPFITAQKLHVDFERRILWR
jgi:hypothetical protein